MTGPVQVARQEYDPQDESVFREGVRKSFKNSYDKRSDMIVPIGKRLAFTSPQGEVVGFGYSAGGDFTISVNDAAAITLTTSGDLDTLEASLTLAFTTGDEDNYTLITTEYTSAVDAVDGKLTGSLGFTVDVNGRIASLKLLSDGTTSAVRFRTDTFEIFNGTTDEAPFEISGGVVKIKTANVGVLTAANISVTDLSAISANLGTITAGQLNLTAGSYVVRHGAGFGASSDLVLWYGLASIAIGSATKTNGVFALATDGEVYLGATVAAPPTPQLSLSVAGNGGVTDYADLETYPTIPAVQLVATASGGAGGYTYSAIRLAATGDAFTTSTGSTDTVTTELSGPGGVARSGSETWLMRVTDADGTVVTQTIVIVLDQLP
jgi:hypothetical protein